MKKRTISRILSAAMSAVLLLTCAPVNVLTAPAEVQAKETENLLKLWYDKPASGGTMILSGGAFGTTAEDNRWQQFTLPIGNSYMGANVYGEITAERLTFNQKTLWTGGPSTSRPNYNGGNKTTASNGKKMTDAYQEVVNAFLNGASNASNLCEQLVGEAASNGYGSYQSWGDIYLTFSGITDANATEYERNLDLATAVANVDFKESGTKYHREYFVSHPDNVLAMKLTAEGSGKLNFNVKFPVDNDTSAALGKTDTYQTDAAKGTIVMKGTMNDNQMKMNSVLQVVTSGGIAANADGKSLDISNASEVVIFVSADTDYANKYPTYRTGETDEQLAASVASTVSKAVEKGYDKVMADHLADYQELFDRVELDLGQGASAKPTDMLLAAYKNNSASDPEKRLLEVLLYQYGRYLTIASSRAGDLPSNLQGVWQNRVGNEGRVPWGSDYHMNVNLQMNYWPTYSANLAECAIPLIDYVDSLREPGRVTAEAYYGIKSENGEENGFTAHTQNTPFGWTCPGWAFSWGWSPAAVPWILQNCWEYYEYTGDVEFMKERLYPMLREEAILYDQILVDSGTPITLSDGTRSTRLVSAPTFSPEQGPRTLGNTYEQSLIWQLYEDAAIAAETLGVDADLAARWKSTQERLVPIEVGDSGQIKEWYIETTLGSVSGTESGHRHMSHLLGLFPGDLISIDNDTYMDAAIVSLEGRGMDATGWGIGQRINAWARTGKGEKAYEAIRTLFNKGIYPNLWDSHPPFQIDGNFGYTSGVNEMLMQSNMGYINVMAAMPKAWNTGSVKGIVARDNFELGIAWEDCTATSVDILSRNGGECAVQYPAIRSAIVKDSKGNEVAAKALGKNRISFDTTAGETYTITGFEKEVKEVEEIDIADTVPKSSWTATAGSEKGSGNDGPASWAIDGNTSNWWHSDYGNGATWPVISENGTNNEFTIDFGKNIEANVFEYIPRNVTNGNGTITGYQLYYSTSASGDDFKLLTSGSWAGDTSAKRAEFDLTTMRRIQIRATSTIGEGGNDKFISAVEFNVYKVVKNTIVPPSSTELNSAIAEAEKMDLDAYTEESAAAFRDALAKAKEVSGYADASQTELDRALAALQKAQENLVKAPTDSKELESALQAAEQKDLKGYTEESVKVFQSALDEAKKVLANPAATQAEINQVLETLKKAELGLKLIEGGTGTEPGTGTEKPVPAVNKTYNVGDFQYKVTKSAATNGQAAVTKLLNTSKKKIVIPDTVVLDGYTFKVTSVAAKAFQKNKKITSVTFGKNIANIGKRSFFGCKKLKAVVFKGTKAPKIKGAAFKGIKAKAKVQVPKKMKNKQFRKLKKGMKSAGKKIRFKKK